MNTTDLDQRPSQLPDKRIVPKVATAQLMKGKREVIIQHGSEEYRLRITSTGKLILTK